MTFHSAQLFIIVPSPLNCIQKCVAVKRKFNYLQNKFNVSTTHSQFPLIEFLIEKPVLMTTSMKERRTALNFAAGSSRACNPNLGDFF